MHSKYNLVIETDLARLISEVNAAIEAGYTTQGGPFQNASGLYVQAIVIPVLKEHS